MQKFINAIAIASGVISLTVVGSGVVIYLQKDAIIENVKSKVMGSVLDSVTPDLGGIAGDSIPSFTGPASPCLLYTSPSPRDATLSRMPSSA